MALLWLMRSFWIGRMLLLTEHSWFDSRLFWICENKMKFLGFCSALSSRERKGWNSSLPDGTNSSVELGTIPLDTLKSISDLSEWVPTHLRSALSTMTFENNFFGHMGFPISVLSMWLMLSTVEQLRETCEYNHIYCPRENRMSITIILSVNLSE